MNQVLELAFPWCLNWEAELKGLFQAYVEAKQRNNCLDYDDLLLYVAQTMSVPELAEEVGDRFDHILVDEYQDTNRLQAGILLALKPHGEVLTVVGDDAQSIYAFHKRGRLACMAKEYWTQPASPYAWTAVQQLLQRNSDSRSRTGRRPRL